MLFEAFLFVTVSSIECSLVRDIENQKGVYVNDYCPNMKYCPEGAHVMCMYYDKDNVMGPKCRDPRNVSISTDIANNLLDVTNALRSKIARGLEKGKNNEPLPRGYGMFRLKWDSELATFAQVLANQCTLRHDFCRATKKFPDPGQNAGIVRFDSANWVPVSKGGKLNTKGLTEEKLSYAVTQSLRTWYRQKSGVDIHMVTNYPDWSKDPANQNGRLYLTMIYGAATHMGCGISAYSDYVLLDQRTPAMYNTVLVICNYSAQPRLGAGVYNTVPPTDTESSFNACGCPIGSLEDDDCLCLEVPRNQEPQVVYSSKTQKCPAGANCDPTVVVLPIFTLEDAPPDKLVVPGMALRHANESHTIAPEKENTIDSFEELFDNNLSGDKGILRQSRKTLDLLPHENSNGKKQRPIQHNNGVTVRNRRFEKAPEADEQHKESPNNHHDNKKPHKQLQRHVQRSSVFTKSPRFELPGSHYFLSSIKKDVMPRKDFSVGKQLVNKYLYNKNSLILPKDNHKAENSFENTETNSGLAKSIETVQLRHDLHTHVKPNDQKEHSEHHEEVHFHDILTTETILNTAEQNIMNHNNEMDLSQDVENTEVNAVTEESDKKLMALLDTLEQRIKHIELRDKEKQIFDARLKKIYGKITGKQSHSLKTPGTDHVNHINKGTDIENSPKSEDDNAVKKLLPSFDVKTDTNFGDETNYHSNHLTETEMDDKYPKTDITDFEPEEIEKSIVNKQKTLSRHRDRVNRRSKNFRRKNHNYLNSLESVRERFSNGFTRRDTFKNAFRNDLGKLTHRSNSLDFKRNKNYYRNDAYDEILSTERIKYYQNKLDSMERKLQDARRFNRRKDSDRSPHMRPLKSSLRTDNQINPLYSGRARILHGY